MSFIDAYPGLTNIAGGTGVGDFGVMHAREVILATMQGLIVGAFVAHEWMDATAAITAAPGFFSSLLEYQLSHIHT